MAYTTRTVKNKGCSVDTEHLQGVSHVNLASFIFKLCISICILATYRDFENVNFLTFFNSLENYMGSKIEIRYPKKFLLLVKRT